jgi:hypothetical protein
VVTEQIIAIPSPKQSKHEDMQIIVGQTACTGASSLKRDLPKIIVFSLPPGKPNEKFYNASGPDKECRGRPDDTYPTQFERIFNYKSKPFDKTLVTLQDDDFSYPITLKKDTPTKLVKQGTIYFLSTGVLFTTPKSAQTVYLPFRSITEATINTDKDGLREKRFANLEILLRVTKPFLS